MSRLLFRGSFPRSRHLTKCKVGAFQGLLLTTMLGFDFPIAGVSKGTVVQAVLKGTTI